MGCVFCVFIPSNYSHLQRLEVKFIKKKYQKDPLGKSYERVVVSDLAILAQKWSKIYMQNKTCCWSLPLSFDGSGSSWEVGRGMVCGYWR